MPTHDGLWCTRTIAVRQFVQMRRKAIENRGSRACKRGRLFARFIAISCWRSARFSSPPRSPNASARPTTINSWSMSRSWLARAPESIRASCGEGHPREVAGAGENASRTAGELWSQGMNGRAARRKLLAPTGGRRGRLSRSMHVRWIGGADARGELTDCRSYSAGPVLIVELAVPARG